MPIPYLTFDGQTAQALNFYAETLTRIAWQISSFERGKRQLHGCPTVTTRQPARLRHGLFRKSEPSAQRIVARGFGQASTKPKLEQSRS